MPKPARPLLREMNAVEVADTATTFGCARYFQLCACATSVSHLRTAPT